MDSESEQLHEQALQLLRSNNKNRALLVLKLKKHKQQAVEKIDGELLTVQQMIQDVEWESMNVEIFKALKAGTAALNKIHEEMTVESVAALLDETNEAIEVFVVCTMLTAWAVLF